MMKIGTKIEVNSVMKRRMGQFAVMLAGLLGIAAQASELGDLPDPTQPQGAAAGGVPSSGVQSIFISPQRKTAVVHGRSVKIGDRVGADEVVDIRPYEVILKRDGRETSLRLTPRLDKQPARGGT